MITPDGCAVDFYARMSAMGEPEIVHDAIPPGRPSSSWAAAPGGSPIRWWRSATRSSPSTSRRRCWPTSAAPRPCHARIEELALGRRFNVVLLASHLINTDDAAARSALLAACLRHVAGDGSVIIQQQAPGWFASAADAENTRDGITFRVRDVSRPAPDLVSATMEYVDGDRVWTHAFTARRLDDAELTAALAGSGLRLDRYLTEDRSWLRAARPEPARGDQPREPPLLRRKERRLAAGPCEPCTLPV